MCCAALSATFLSTANETVRTHQPFTNMLHFELQLCFGFTESYAACADYWRGPIPKSTSAACRYLTASHRAHGALRPCWYSRRCKGVDAVESRVLYRTLSCSPQGPYRVLCSREISVGDPTSTQVCTQREPTMGVQGTAHRSTAASSRTDRRQSWPC